MSWDGKSPPEPPPLLASESSGAVARRMVSELAGRLPPAPTETCLEILDGPETGVVLELRGERAFVLGRAAAGDLRLDDVDLWREHVTLVRDPKGVTLRDVGASPALLVNGKRPSEHYRLRDGDRVRLGQSTLRFCDPAQAYLDRLEAAAHPPAPHRPVAKGRAPEMAILVAGMVALAAAGSLLYLYLGL